MSRTTTQKTIGATFIVMSFGNPSLEFFDPFAKPAPRRQ
jgi:hypothetical protein